MPHIKQGKLRPLAVGSAKRVAALPDLPTVAEAGVPGFETSQWYGILAPAGTPDAIVRKMANEVNRILKTPESWSGSPPTAPFRKGRHRRNSRNSSRASRSVGAAS
jgi:tripartite-type tricarboxylate transporter receptor subunit TctC